MLKPVSSYVSAWTRQFIQYLKLFNNQANLHGKYELDTYCMNVAYAIRLDRTNVSAAGHPGVKTVQAAFIDNYVKTKYKFKAIL